MSKQARRSLFPALLILACLTTGRAQAQAHTPDFGRAGLAIEEPTSTIRTTTDPATRLWQRIMTWSTHRTSDQRWRALYSRPSAAPVRTLAKAAPR